jgi:putative hydrolase of the HAD superfamily
LPIHAVFFDVGGVLEITPATGWTEQWAAQLGLSDREFADRCDDIFAAGAIGALDEDAVNMRLAEALQIDAATVDAMMSDAWAEYLGAPNRELIDYAAELRRRCRVGIISNSFVGARWREQDLYGFEDRFDDIVYSHELGILKPMPAIYSEACRRLGVEPFAAVLLDDWQPAVEGAWAAGMSGVLFENNEQAISDLEALLAS